MTEELVKTMVAVFAVLAMCMSFAAFYEIDKQDAKIKAVEKRLSDCEHGYRPKPPVVHEE